MRSRLLVIVLLALISLTGILAFFSFFGFFNKLTNTGIFLVLCATLYSYKLKGNLEVTFLIAAVICTSFMIYNTVIDGYILSMNNKWFTIALITIFFIKPKWLGPYTLMLMGLQVFYWTRSKADNLSQEMTNLANEELVDNILLFGLCYALLNLLNKHQEALNNRIKDSNKKLENKALQLIQSNRELENFAFLASHDIKTPLRNIISFAGLLEREIRNNRAGAKELEYTGFIKNGSMKLDRLVSDVLSYSRLTSSEDSIENIALSEVIKEIETTISKHLQIRNAEISVESNLPVIRANRTMIYQLIKNLIENGIKYNESNEPRITISYSNSDGNHYMSISDNGIGIEKAYHDTIFKMFSRVHTEDYEGSGIGLSLCKRIIDKLGGKITIHSEIGVGTSFHLHFPASIIQIHQKKK